MTQAQTSSARVQAGQRPSTPLMRGLMVVSGMLVFLVGIQLFILTEFTETLFAWTINPPLTAAFLGAGYWAAFGLEVNAARQRTWARLRVAVPAVWIFTTLTLIVTLMHLDRFHLNAPSALTRLAAWVWIAVYASVPVALAVGVLLQLRVPGAEAAKQKPLPGWLMALLGLQGGAMLLLGLGLLAAPQAVSGVWPWMLTPLTGRAVGAWLVGLAVAVIYVIWDNDLPRARPVAGMAVLFAVLELIAFARYAGDAVADARTWVYLAFLLSLLAAGAAGWLLGRERA